ASEQRRAGRGRVRDEVQRHDDRAAVIGTTDLPGSHSWTPPFVQTGAIEMRTADPNFIVRRMRPDGVELIRTWATAEGWNPGLHTGPCFFATDPEGFFVGEFDGRPVACISCVAYDASFGFVGLYIVHPELRGRGYGLQIWRAGMAHLGTRNVGLDGVLAQQSNYKRSGFAVAHDHIRYRGEGGGPSPAGGVCLPALPVRGRPAPHPGCL